MRNLEFFYDQRDYEDHIWRTIFTEPWVYDTPFYRNLVNYVIDHHAPIFYQVSDSSEHFAFSGAYYFETRRTRYPSKTREQLFWLHDFTHMLFPYSHDVYEVSEKDFLAQFWYQERIASSETEIMSYYRVPGLREKVFEDEKLWYDVIRERGWSTPYTGMGWTIADDDPDRMRFSNNEKPHPSDFLKYRVRVQMEDEFGEHELGDHPDILKFVQQWRRLTPGWISKRYRSVAGMRVEAPVRDRNFTAENYEDRIDSYTSSNRVPEEDRQKNYEQNVTANVRMAYDLLGWEDKPQRWRHMPEAIDRLEGAVLLR